MGIDWSQFAIPKGPLRVEEKRRKRLDAETLEREARAAVKARDLGKCRIPGCKERATELHHIVYRSKSKRLMWATANLVSLCKGHHAMEHGGRITITGNADEEIIITGDTKALRFKL